MLLTKLGIRPPKFFLPLLASLTADSLVMLIAPIIVYAYTESLSMSGVIYTNLRKDG